MLADTTILVLSAILMFLMASTASFLRCQGWTPSGRELAFGNRDNLPPETALAGRASRAANNMLEGIVLFIALFAAVHVANKVDAQSQLGANLFFWGRLVYWPVYLAGIVYLRTLVWFVSVAGLALMTIAALR
jgi:uncharacterized MAPEG superfamily protein